MYHISDVVDSFGRQQKKLIFPEIVKEENQQAETLQSECSDNL